MALITRELMRSYEYVFRELRDPRVDDHFLMSSPLPIMLILASYLFFVKSLGPRLMRDRPAFKLDRIIQVYDVVQIILSLYTIERLEQRFCLEVDEQKGEREFILKGLLQCITLASNYSWFCEPVDYSTSTHAKQVMNAAYVYFLIKIIDLMDTIFFVLRKKNTQITFLHVYHHAAMAAGLWVGVKFIAGGHSAFLGFINSIVHVVMYSYYLVTSIYPQYKNNIWWKKHITQMQMVQFMLIIVHSGQVLLQPNCKYPWGYSLFLVPQNFFMLVLFYDFYRKAYLSKTGKVATTPSQRKTD